MALKLQHALVIGDAMAVILAFSKGRLSSHAPGEVAQATSPEVWAPRQGLSRQEQSFLESSTVRPDSGDLPSVGKPSWEIPLETVPKLDRALVWYLNEKFFDGEAGHAASKVLGAVAYEWAGISKGIKGISRAVQACRGFPPILVVILLINEMIRLGNLAAAQATALTFALWLRPQKPPCVCVKIRWCPRCEWQATPKSGASFCTPKSGA